MPIARSLFFARASSMSVASVVVVTTFFVGGCDDILPNNQGQTDDGGVVILDGGLGRGDGGPERDGGEDAGIVADAGPFDAGAPGDAGIVVDAGGADAGADGGFVFPGDGGLPNIDGGLIEYEGDAELGVRCGTPLETCAANVACCVAQEGFTFSGTCNATCDSFSLGCDDRQQDCSDDDVCCFVLEVGFPLTLNSTCMSASACAAIDADPEQPDSAETCVSSSECGGGQSCCGVSVAGLTLPFDIGICRDSCDL